MVYSTHQLSRLLLCRFKSKEGRSTIQDLWTRKFLSLQKPHTSSSTLHMEMKLTAFNPKKNQEMETTYSSILSTLGKTLWPTTRVWLTLKRHLKGKKDKFNWNVGFTPIYKLKSFVSAAHLNLMSDASVSSTKSTISVKISTTTWHSKSWFFFAH